MKKTPLALILTSVSTPEQAADDKQSLDSQERDLRAIADERGWKVIDVLRVPGFSRNFISWEECAQEMAKQGIPAMADLKRYVNDHAFDIFMVRDADRFGRTQSLIMQIAETICIRHRLKIYSQIDNTLVEGEAARFWAAMTGLRAAGEMDKKKIYREKGMKKRAELGFHESHTPWYHRTVHDKDTGKALRVEVREEYRYIWDAAFEVIVTQRIGFQAVEKVMYEKYQIVNPQTGRPFREKAIYEILCMSPAAWGHRFRGKRQRRKSNVGGMSGRWVYDRSVPPPAEIEINYDVMPAIYTGQQADDMIAELNRRRDIRGGFKATNPSAFSGLVVCDYCDNHMVYNQRHKLNWNWAAYRCQTHERARYGGPDCPCKPKYIKHQTLVDFVDGFLKDLISGVPLETAFPINIPSVADEIAALEQQFAAVSTEQTRLIQRLGVIPDSMLPQYQKQLVEVADRAEALKTRLAALKLKSSEQDRSDQVAAIGELDRIGVDEFWKWEPGRQQQFLRRVFGKWRIIVADGVIVSIAQAGKRQPRRILNSSSA